MWVHRDNDQIVGHMGAIPVRVKVGNDVRDTAWLVETMVLEAYRPQAIGAQLMVRAHEDVPFALSLGQSPEMREIQFKLGWSNVVPLQVAQLLINPDRVLEGKLPKPAAWVAGLGLRASTRLRQGRERDPHHGVRTVERFDCRHDQLWTGMSSDIACAVIRDASYLNWKYVDQPGQSYTRLELLDEDDDNKVLGVAVLAFREPDDAYRYRRALLVDLVAPLNDGDLLGQLLAAAVGEATAAGADAVWCSHAGAPLTRALKVAGFHLRTPKRYLLVDAHTLPESQRLLVVTGENWFLTQGDSDIDRPGHS